MDSNSWKNSYLKREWFFDEKTLPSHATQTVVNQVLVLYQQTAALAQSLMAPMYHEHPCTSMQVSRCLTCQTLDKLSAHLCPLFLHLDGVVMDFFHEGEHHEDLVMAVRLYSFALLLILSGHVVRDQQELREYAQYRLEELSALSFEQKRRGEYDEKTGGDEKSFLVEVFIEVYTTLLDELDSWKTIHPHLPLVAFPAKCAQTLLLKRSGRSA